MELYILILALILGAFEVWNFVFGLYNILDGDSFTEGFCSVCLFIFNSIALGTAIYIPYTKFYLLLFSAFVGLIIGGTIARVYEEYMAWG